MTLSHLVMQPLQPLPGTTLAGFCRRALSEH
jgi:hypothetical protein